MRMMVPLGSPRNVSFMSYRLAKTILSDERDVACEA